MVERNRHVQRDLLRDGPDGCWEDDVAAALGRGDAVEPAGRRWSANDDVGPGHFETAQNNSCSDCDDGLGDHGGGSESNEKAEEELVGKVGNDSDLKATEARPWAGFLAKMIDCGADFRSNGF